MSKVVLITGASRGIGRVMATHLVDSGHVVYGTSRSPSGDYPYHMLRLDVTDPASVETCVSELLEQEGKIDVLINNAAIVWSGPLEVSSTEEIQQQFDILVFGMHRMVRAVLPHMLDRREGLIINMGSFAGRLATPYQGLYGSAKAAVANYTANLRIELMRKGVNVVLIEPMDTRTDELPLRKLPAAYDPKDHPIAERTIEFLKEEEANGMDPMRVAKVIGKLVKKGGGKPRYVVGFFGDVVNFLMRILPYRIQEWGIRQYFGIPKSE